MDLSDLTPVAIGFVVVGIVIAFGQNILASIKTGFTANSYEANTTTAAQSANDAIAQKLPLLGLVIAAAIIIGVLLKAFRS